jgi:hypothetical protein
MDHIRMLMTSWPCNTQSDLFLGRKKFDRFLWV